MTHKRYQSHEAEIEKLHYAVIGHMKRWSDLEIALSALLYEILHIQPRSSHIAYAIYFSPDGFDARWKLVDHTLKQFLQERPDCAIIQEGWDSISTEIQRSRRIRNGVAHGGALILNIRGKLYVRHCPPGFDILRVGNKVRKGSIPGLSEKEIMNGCKDILLIVDCLDALNRLIVSFHEHGPASLKEKYAELASCLRKLPDRRPSAQTQQATLDQPQPSSE